MEPIQTTQSSEQTRAKAISTGETPLQTSNVILGLPNKPITAPLLDNSAVLSSPWSYSDLISQKRLVADLTISTSSEGIVWVFRNTWLNVMQTFIKRLEPLFTMKSWTIEFELMVQSNFQQVGQAILFYTNIPEELVPYHFNLTIPADATDPMLNYLFQTQMPHLKIPFGENSNFKFPLDWISPFKSGFGASSFRARNAVNAPDYDMGTLRLAIAFPMEVATGVTPELSIRIYGSLKNVTYGGYVPTDAII